MLLVLPNLGACKADELHHSGVFKKKVKSHLKANTDDWSLIRERPLHRCCYCGGGGLPGSPMLAYSLCVAHMHQGFDTVIEGMVCLPPQQLPHRRQQPPLYQIGRNVEHTVTMGGSRLSANASAACSSTTRAKLASTGSVAAGNCATATACWQSPAAQPDHSGSNDFHKRTQLDMPIPQSLHHLQ
jgi:hypothetical protein